MSDEVTQMVYLDSGEIEPRTFRVITIDPALKWDVVCLLPFVSTEAYASPSQLQVIGEIGAIGDCRIVVSSDTSGIKDIATVRSLVWRGVT